MNKKAQKIIKGSAITAVSLGAALTAASYALIKVMLVHPPKNDADHPSMLMGPKEHAKAFSHFSVNNTQKLEKLPYEDFFVNSDDELKLHGRFYKSDCGSKTTIICIHGYNMDGPTDFAGQGLMYMSHGFNVLLADNRHHGKSEGDYIGMGALDKYDVPKWAEYVNSKIPDGDIFLIGVSMGGATVAQASEFHIKNLRGIIDDCGYTSVGDEVKFLAHHMLPVPIPAVPVVNISEAFCKKLAGYDFTSSSSLEAVKHATVPMLFIHGEGDVFVPSSMGKEIFDACTSEKEALFFPGTQHAQSFFDHPKEYEDAVMAFINKYSTHTSAEKETAEAK